jgi:hypothetical protein
MIHITDFKKWNKDDHKGKKVIIKRNVEPLQNAVYNIERALNAAT